MPRAKTIPVVNVTSGPFLVPGFGVLDRALEPVDVTVNEHVVFLLHAGALRGPEGLDVDELAAKFAPPAGDVDEPTHPDPEA